ncbi:MAG: hypothetical protein AB7F25_12405 [Deferribacterales bacterium]
MEIKVSATELKKILELTNKEIAEALGKSERAIEMYFSKATSQNNRDMPEADKRLLILRYKIKEKGLDPDELINEFYEDEGL